MTIEKRLISINIGQERSLSIGSKTNLTGIYKSPVGQALVTKAGMVGDRIVDDKHHGGPDQAVYVYTQEDYTAWRMNENLLVESGTFGENLVVSGVDSGTMVIGDRLIFDSVILEVTAPRIPCSTLSSKIGDPEFVKKFVKMQRPGFYCRVIQEGELKIDSFFTVERSAGPKVTILDLYQNYYNHHSAETLEIYLSAPVAIRTRIALEKQLNS